MIGPTIDLLPLAGGAEKVGRLEPKRLKSAVATRHPGSSLILPATATSSFEPGRRNTRERDGTTSTARAAISKTATNLVFQEPARS